MFASVALSWCPFFLYPITLLSSMTFQCLLPIASFPMKPSTPMQPLCYEKKKIMNKFALAAHPPTPANKIERTKGAFGYPPPPRTTLIPHIEVGFKWMWTQLATPNKMAPVFVDLCAGLVVLLPRQIRRFRHGFFSSAVLDWSLRSCVRVRHLWRQQIADNRRYLRRSFLPWTSSLRSQISLSKRL